MKRGSRMQNIEPKNNISNLYKNIKTISDKSKMSTSPFLKDSCLLNFLKLEEELKII
jgi:hypothetical protein